MAWFTMCLWEVLDLTNDPGDGSTIGLGVNDYPIFDENFRQELNQKIINHYWNWEIGVPTISMFRFAMARRMNEQMPLLNQAYKSTLLTLDPLTNVSLTTNRDDTTTEKTTRDSTNDTTVVNTSGSRSVTFDTPQTALSGSEDYASGAVDVNSAGNTTNNGTGHDTGEVDGTVNGKSTTTGYQGSVSDLLMKYRATFLNVDMMVLESLQDCFMQIWRTEDEMLPQIGMGF
jgi:hypothetical protein